MCYLVYEQILFGLYTVIIFYVDIYFVVLCIVMQILDYVIIFSVNYIIGLIRCKISYIF